MVKAKIRRGSAATGMVGSILLFAVVLGLLLVFGVDEQITQLLLWIEQQGAWAGILFVVLMLLVTVFLLPGVFFTTGAGFAFGLIEGVVYVVVGTTLGAVLAFLIARHLMGERAAQFVRSHSRLESISRELIPEGWKIIMLTRLVPLFPFKVSNYFFGLSGVSLRSFTLGTLVGIIPFSLHNVYLGSIAADIAMLGAGQSSFTPLQWLLYGGGFIAVVILVLYINRLARRALARYTEDDEAGEI